MNHFLSIADLTPHDLQHILEVAYELRSERQRGEPNEPVLAGQTLALLFEKPSLRTRVSFEQAMVELGGYALVLGQHEVGLGKRESVADVTRVLCGMVHGIAARVFAHSTLTEMAAHSTAPVVNMLSDHEHPCQALADVMTILDEFAGGTADTSKLLGRTVAFIGDGNNVARSLALSCGKLGMNFTLAAPAGYEMEPQLFEQVAAGWDGTLKARQIRDPFDAVKDADVVVTDTFVSMGQEDEKAQRLQAFKNYQVNEALMAAAPKHAIVLHCLPAYRGIEITDGVMDGPQSRVFPEAHNRLHAQKGMLAVVMGGR